MQLHFERVLVVAQQHGGVCAAFNGFGLVGNVVQLCARVSVVVEHRQCGFEVVLAAASGIGFPSASADGTIGAGHHIPVEQLQVGFVAEFRSEIRLVESSVVAHLQEQVGLVRSHTDHSFLVSLRTEASEEREEKEQSLY